MDKRPSHLQWLSGTGVDTKSATASSTSVIGSITAAACTSIAANTMRSTDTPAPSRGTSALHTTWTETVSNASHTTSSITYPTLGSARPSEIPPNFDWLSYLNRTVICPDGAAPDVTLKGVLIDAFCQPPIHANATMIQSLSSVATLSSTVPAQTTLSTSRTNRPESSAPKRPVFDNATIPDNSAITTNTRLGGFFIGPLHGHAIDFALRRIPTESWITKQGHQYALNFGFSFDIALLSAATKSKRPECICYCILVSYTVRPSAQISPKRSPFPSHQLPSPKVKIRG